MTIPEWLTALEERHLADLTPTELARALRALSSCYVERRDRLATGGALDSAGKRAAFALFYGPQHFIVTREVASRLSPAADAPGASSELPRCTRVVDLGCGTGAAGAAAAIEFGARSIEGYDVNAWAVREASWTYRSLGLRGRARVANILRVRVPAEPGALLLAAYAVNELADGTRAGLLDRFVQAQRAGAAILVIEPIARRVNRWWTEWADVFRSLGGRDDDWRFAAGLPSRQRALARAAGLDVQELTARSLYLPPYA